jgi:cytochrome c biogenesis protein CcmG/thiol:disulfide interchange protein DsbE
MRWIAIIPLVLFLALCAMFVVRMSDDKPTDEIPSALIGKPAPALTLQPMASETTPLLSSDIYNQGKVVVLNVWASHCGPCRIEHPQIKALSEIDGVIVAGLNQKDDPKNAARFLNLLGNPFDYLGADPDGAVSLQYGVYGLPETFVIDRSGNIRAKFIGAISPEQLEQEVRPLIERLKRGP